MIDFNFFFYDINKFDRNNNNNKRERNQRQTDHDSQATRVEDT